MCASTAIIGKPWGVVKVNRKELPIDDCRFSIGSNQLLVVSGSRNLKLVQSTIGNWRASNLRPPSCIQSWGCKWQISTIPYAILNQQGEELQIHETSTPGRLVYLVYGTPVCPPGRRVRTPG